MQRLRRSNRATGHNYTAPGTSSFRLAPRLPPPPGAGFPRGDDRCRPRSRPWPRRASPTAGHRRRVAVARLHRGVRPSSRRAARRDESPRRVSPAVCAWRNRSGRQRARGVQPFAEHTRAGSPGHRCALPRRRQSRKATRWTTGGNCCGQARRSDLRRQPWPTTNATGMSPTAAHAHRRCFRPPRLTGCLSHPPVRTASRRPWTAGLSPRRGHHDQASPGGRSSPA